MPTTTAATALVAVHSGMQSYTLSTPPPILEQTDGLDGPAGLNEQLLAVHNRAINQQAAVRDKLVVANRQLIMQQQKLQRLKDAGRQPIADGFKSRQAIQRAEKAVQKAAARTAELFNVMSSARGLMNRASAAPHVVPQQYIKTAVQVAEADLIAAQQHYLKCSNSLQEAQLAQLSHHIMSTAIITVVATGKDCCSTSHEFTVGLLAIAITAARDAKRAVAERNITARKANAAAGHAFNHLAGVRSVTTRRRQGENIQPHPLEVLLTQPDYETEYAQAVAAYEAALAVESDARAALTVIKHRHASVVKSGKQHAAAIYQQEKAVCRAGHAVHEAEQELNAADQAVAAAAHDVSVARQAKGIAPAVVCGAKHTLVNDVKSLLNRVKVVAVLVAVASLL